MSEITNTQKTPPEILLGEALLQGSSQSIEAMERRGGEEMLRSEMLPVDGSESSAVQALGIEWGPPDSDDPIFREARLPEGWTRASGDNPYGYWTYLVDERGEERAGIFYKTAFYDRKARISDIPLCLDQGCRHSSNAHRWQEELPIDAPQSRPCSKCDCTAMVEP